MPVGSGNMTAEAREFVIAVPVSFETGEQVTGLRITPPTNSDWRLVAIDYHVIKALAATDVGLIDVKDASGNAAITQLSIPLSTVIDTRGSCVVSTVDARVCIGAKQASAYHAITAAKTTAGGKVLLLFKYRRIKPATVQG
jgi:hypothetical protein